MDIESQLNSALIIEQQSLAQSHIKYSLQNLHFERIDFVDRAHLALEALKKNKYQLVMCAFELNKGADGFQLFEKMHKQGLIGPSTAVVFTSSEQDAQLTQSVIELNPDDFLLKPFTTKELESRLRRVLNRKLLLHSVYSALEVNDNESALREINHIISENENPKFMTVLMKLKGETLCAAKQWPEVEMFYQSVLKVKHFEWAELGLIKARIKQGKIEDVDGQLQKLLKSMATQLSAHELLAQVHEQKNEFDAALEHIRQASEIAPRNIERQQHLVGLARITYDYDTLHTAANNIIKNLKNSYHESPDNYLTAVRANVDYGLTSFDEQESLRVAQQSQHILDSLKKKFPQTPLDDQIDVATARIHHLKNEPEKARVILRHQLENRVSHLTDDLEDALDLAKALHELGFHKESSRIFDEIAQVADSEKNKLFCQFINNEKQLREEVRFSPKKLNNDAVAYYSRGKYNDALSAFKTAFKIMPKNAAIALNLLQTIAESNHVDLTSADTQALIQRCQVNISKAKLNTEQQERYKKIVAMLEEERV